MRIVLINASPKVKNSSSGTLLEDLKYHLSKDVEVVECGFHTAVISHEMMEELNNADAWVFAYPLYVDGVPGHFLSCLVQLEAAYAHTRKVHVYGIVNCGFYEGIQNEFALKILQNWCAKAGVIWGGGIGVGGGGGLAMMPKLESRHGPGAPIDKTLSVLADHIFRQNTQENRYVSVAVPRFMYKMAAQMGWRQSIKANGGKTKDLGKTPE